MAAPTELERKLIEKFRENIRDVALDEEQQRGDDMFLLSWIRARENDLTKAEDMFRKSMEMRRKEGLANISTWSPPPSYPTVFPTHISGPDNEGRPVVFLPLGSWDVRKVVDLGERALYVRYADQAMAGWMKAAREAQMANGDRHTQFVIIIDVKGLGIRQFTSPSTVDTLLETFRRFEANYPETLKTAYVVNAARIFPMAFELVKPFLSQRTRNKIQIFNSNMTKWKAALLERIPEKSLPVNFRESNDEEEDVNENNTTHEQRMERRVEAGGKLEIHVMVSSPDSLLEWEFETVDYDIGFAIYHETTQVYAYGRWDSHVDKAKGSVICRNSGKHTLIFDNSYSRMRSKIVRYTVNVADENV